MALLLREKISTHGERLNLEYALVNGVRRETPAT